MDLSICLPLDLLSSDSDSESESESDNEKLTNVLRFRGAVVGFIGDSEADEEEVQKEARESWVFLLDTDNSDRDCNDGFEIVVGIDDSGEMMGCEWKWRG